MLSLTVYLRHGGCSTDDGRAPMKTICSGNRTILALAAAFAVSNLLATSAFAGQRPEVQRLFQSGSYDEAVQAAENADPASVYVAAQAMVKAEQSRPRPRAVLAPARKRQPRVAVDRAVRRSARLRRQRPRGGAGAQAIDADGDNPFAFYQLGLAASQGQATGAPRSSSLRARDRAQARLRLRALLRRAVAISVQRQLPKAAEHFDAFLRLAPEAPERQAVQAIMRTLK